MDFPIFSASHSSMMELHPDANTDSLLESERSMIEWTRYQRLLQRDGQASKKWHEELEKTYENLPETGTPPHITGRPPESPERENINNSKFDLHKIVPQSLFPLFILSFTLKLRELLPSRKTLKSTLKHGRNIPIMAPKTYVWISLWFLVTFPVIFWDVGFCFMRPRSFEGGDLHWYWSPYKIYQNVDLVYGVEAYRRGDGFAAAQSFLNVIENLLNGVYLYTAHVAKWPPATLVGFTAAALTLAKTALYWAQEYFCNYCAVGHNDLKTLLVYWILPNGLWLLFPGLIVYTLGKDLVSQLNYADKAAKMAKLQKGR